MEDYSDIMRFEEVMEYLSISKSTLYNLLQSGKINSFKIGRVWRIPKSSVDEYIRNSLLIKNPSGKS